MIKSILTEYGLLWAVNRGLYSAKLRMLRAIPRTEVLFEPKTIAVRRTNIFSIPNEQIAGFLRRAPTNKREELLRMADDACLGRVTGFSSIPLDYGYPINWQLNPTTGKSCDARAKWYRILDFDDERGDIKVIWEISRFSHFLTLARAYLLSGDRRYYRAFSDQLDDWLKQNRYSYGANFKCGQECALRMVNALMAYTVFRNANATSEADENNVKALIDRCYRKIRSNFFYAHRCIKNNHTISELLGMIVGAWCCEDWRRLDKAYRMLNRVIAEQFSKDGGYRQFSFNYQRLVLQDIECLLSISETTGHTLSGGNLQRVLNSAMLLYQCQDEMGDVPNYGSNDGALIFPVTSCDYRDFRPVVNTIHALVKGTRLYGAGAHDEELLWFGGGQNVDVYPLEEVKRASAAFSDAGIFTLRRDGAWAMVILNDYRSRPSHMDQLHIDLWVDGVNALCDSGTFSYASELGKVLASTGGHNTVVLDDKEQMSSRGHFMICDWTRRGICRWTQTDFVGEMISVSGYAHKREVKSTDEGFWITDTISGTAGAPFELRFHTLCDVQIDGYGVRLSSNGKYVCGIHTDRLCENKEACRSLFYLQKEKTNCICIHGIVGKDAQTVNTHINI